MMVSIVFPFHHSPLTTNKLCLMPAARMIEAGAEGVSQDRGHLGPQEVFRNYEEFMGVPMKDSLGLVLRNSETPPS